MLFAGTSHPNLAREVATYLGWDLASLHLGRFPDGEVEVQVLDDVRGRDVFVLQTLAGDPDHFLMEMLVLFDALKRASARSITAVIPYYGYCRQDRKSEGRAPITAKLVADLIQTAGGTRVVTMDLHAAQIEGFFNMPVDNLFAKVALLQVLKKESIDVVAAPDVGGIKIARAFADRLSCNLCVLDKQRVSADQVSITTLIGEVQGRSVLLVDDLISTGATISAATTSLLQRGAKRVLVAVSHGLFCRQAKENIMASGVEKLYVTNTVPVAERGAEQIEVVSIAPLFGEAIQKIVSAESPLFS
ncbi:MAG: ribose-phosphate diphosphokinase [Verrucomicrobia bacterium]|nr:ribose-phosphate diphosphokinase [Verrucomicrobiota bacterium]